MKEIKDYRSSHLGNDKARSYHQQFQNNRYRAMIWDKEKIILNEIVKKNFLDNGVGHYLDFCMWQWTCSELYIKAFRKNYWRRFI